MKAKKTGMVALILAAYACGALASPGSWVTAISPEQEDGNTWQIDAARIERPQYGYVAYWVRRILARPDQNGVASIVTHIAARCGGDYVKLSGTVMYNAGGNVISVPIPGQKFPAPSGSIWDALNDRACAM